jgi:hypothetical protein
MKIAEIRKLSTGEIWLLRAQNCAKKSQRCAAIYTAAKPQMYDSAQQTQRFSPNVNCFIRTT